MAFLSEPGPWVSHDFLQNLLRRCLSTLIAPPHKSYLRHKRRLAYPQEPGLVGGYLHHDGWQIRVPCDNPKAIGQQLRAIHAFDRWQRVKAGEYCAAEETCMPAGDAAAR